MRADTGRRLTGRSLWLDGPGVAVEVTVSSSSSAFSTVGGDDWQESADTLRDLHALIAAASMTWTSLMSAVSGGDPDVGAVQARLHRGGVTLAARAPEDALYTCADAFAVAVHRCLQTPPSVFSGDDNPDQDEDFAVLLAQEAPAQEATLRERFARERDPALMALVHEARRRQIPAVFDDEWLLLGQGHRARRFSVVRWDEDGVDVARDLPTPDDINWEPLGAIPVVLVTGTNGKTTTARLIARMLTEAGHTVGMSSTDGLVVGGQVIERGDWSGPGGARAILANPSVTAAVLETARGGLLRRGLPVSDIDVAVVTNVSSDHLGEYGIWTVEEMAGVKGLVAFAVRPGGTFVRGVDDGVMAELAIPDGVRARVGRALLHRSNNGNASVVVDGVTLETVTNIPITHGGLASFNVENVCTATAAAAAIDGVTADHLRAALRSFRPSSRDSAGRGVPMRAVDGRLVLLDFAHNPAAAAATLQWARGLADTRGGALHVVTGAPGDRSDEDIDGVTAAIASVAPASVVARELDAYRRGRAPWEVPTLMQRQLQGRGVHDVTIAANDVAALHGVLPRLGPRDVLAFLVLVDRQGVGDALRAAGFQNDDDAADDDTTDDDAAGV